MKQIDLDDLPPRVAQLLIGLADGEVLTLVQGGGLVARLKVSQPAATPDPLGDLPTEEAMEEVLDHFKSMIEDEF
jgi:antitoxin (DNA-binding transcriptional repressor) of toxin-antitoxin stability system